MSKILIVFLFFGLFQCDKPEVNAEKGIAGEWRYVGTFKQGILENCLN